jgi:hypothetical protein
MKKQSFLLLAASFGGLAMASAGCLWGSDPNKNSQLLPGVDGSVGTGSGGTSGGSGGTSGGTPAMGAIVGSPLATFDSTTDGFVLNSYHDTGSKNLGDPNSGASPAPTLMLDAADGNPSAGSLVVTAPFSGANQYVDIQNTSKFGTASPKNLTGGKMHVRIRVDAGGSFGGIAEPYVITTAGFVFGGTSTNFAKNNNWQEFVVNLDSPGHPDSGYDASKVVIFGVQLSSGSAGGSQGPVTFHVDSFSVEGVVLGTGGTGGGGGSDAAGTGGSGGTSAADGAAD